MAAHGLSTIKWLWLLPLVWACATSPSGVPSEQRPLSVAVLDYEDLSPLDSADPDLSELLTATAIATIEDTGRFDVVERQHLATILEELHLGSSSVVDPQARRQLGLITGARLMVFGSYQVIANQLRLDVRLVEVETGRVLNAVSVMPEENNLPEWLEAAARSTAALFQY
jgi:curli biogenesis system outer membrane secretion channel CsgG